MKNRPNRLLFSLIVYSVLLILLVSCQKTQSYIPVYYNITNTTDSKIIVFCNIATAQHDYGQVHDSIFTVQSGNKTTLFVSLFRYSYNPGNPETEDTLSRITDLRIYNNDSIESNKDFRLTKYWEYSEMTSKSNLDLNVNPDDF